MPALPVPVTPATVREDPDDAVYPSLLTYPGAPTPVPHRTLTAPTNTKTVPVTPA